MAVPPVPSSAVSCASVSCSRTMRNASDSGWNRADKRGPQRHFSSRLVDMMYRFTFSSYASSVAVCPSQFGTTSKDVIFSEYQLRRQGLNPAP